MEVVKNDVVAVTPITTLAHQWNMMCRTQLRAIRRCDDRVVAQILAVLAAATHDDGKKDKAQTRRHLTRTDQLRPSPRQVRGLWSVVSGPRGAYTGKAVSCIAWLDVIG